jgi:hypothetical protein
MGRYKNYKRDTKTVVDYLAKHALKRSPPFTTATLVVMAREVAWKGVDLPSSVSAALRNAIRSRHEQAIWYRSLQAMKRNGQPEALASSNRSHAYFLDTLRGIYSELLKPTSPAQTKSDRGPEVAHSNYYACLGVDEPSESSTLAADAASLSTNMSRQHASDGSPSKSTSTHTSVRNDAAFAAWCYYMDLQDAVILVEQVWDKYSTGQASYFAATLISCEAILLFRTVGLESGYGTFFDLMTDIGVGAYMSGAAGNTLTVHCGSLIGQSQSNADRLATSFEAFACFSDFSRVLSQPDQTPPPISGQTHEHPFRRNLSRAAGPISRLGKNASDKRLDAFSIGLLEIARGGGIPCCMIMACQIYMIIHEALGYSPERGLESISDSAIRLSSRIDELHGVIAGRFWDSSCHSQCPPIQGLAHGDALHLSRTFPLLPAHHVHSDYKLAVPLLYLGTGHQSQVTKLVYLYMTMLLQGYMLDWLDMEQLIKLQFKGNRPTTMAACGASMRIALGEFASHKPWALTPRSHFFALHAAKLGAANNALLPVPDGLAARAGLYRVAKSYGIHSDNDALYSPAQLVMALTKDIMTQEIDLNFNYGAIANLWGLQDNGVSFDSVLTGTKQSLLTAIRKPAVLESLASFVGRLFAADPDLRIKNLTATVKISSFAGIPAPSFESRFRREGGFFVQRGCKLQVSSSGLTEATRWQSCILRIRKDLLVSIASQIKDRPSTDPRLICTQMMPWITEQLKRYKVPKIIKSVKYITIAGGFKVECYYGFEPATIEQIISRFHTTAAPDEDFRRMFEGLVYSGVITEQAMPG